VSDEINAKEIESANLELWETHAKWWQDNFSEGADPEYEEQILPLIQAWSQGFTKILDVEPEKVRSYGNSQPRGKTCLSLAWV